MNSLWQAVLDLDRHLFLWLNTALAADWLDTVMVWITLKETWYIPAALLVGGLLWTQGARGRVITVALILAVVLGDQISSSLLKPWLERLRPCKSMEGFRLLVHCGSMYGFPSSHATNAAAVATPMALWFPRWRSLWAVYALVVGFTRIYVGVHFPLDVLAGWLLGGLIGWGLYRAAGGGVPRPVLLRMVSPRRTGSVGG